jgi:hypothetical protein
MCYVQKAIRTMTPATSADQEPQLPACTAAPNKPNSPQEDIQDPAATQSGSNQSAGVATRMRPQRTHSQQSIAVIGDSGVPGCELPN